MIPIQGPCLRGLMAAWHMGWGLRIGPETDLDLTSSFAITSCVTLGKLLNISELQLLQLLSELSNSGTSQICNPADC